jgi:hypothetical protein
MDAIVFDPLVPLSFVLAAFAIWGAVVLYTVFVTRRLSLYRIGALLFVFAALLNPSWRDEVRAPLTDIAFLVIDETASQSVSDRPEQTKLAVQEIQAALAKRPNVEVRTLRIHDDDSGRDLGTRLMSKLAEAVAAEPRNRLAGAILITDGQVHDAEALPDMDAPVHVLLSGRQSDWDRRIIVKQVPSFAIVGEEVQMVLRVEDAGRIPSDSDGFSTIRVSIDGADDLEFRVPLNDDITIPLILPHAGANVLQFTVPPSPDELTDRNNIAVVSVNGVRDRLRVLLVSGEPHPGERVWRNLLKSDGAVDLVHFTILRPPNKQDGVPVTELSLIAFPTRELFIDKVDEFDLIIFDRYRRRGILNPSYLENVARYVRDGGAVLISAGPEFAGAESLFRTGLSEVMPAEPTANVLEEGFTPQISALGLKHPVTEGLDLNYPTEDETPGWGQWLRMIEVVADGGQTVMTGPDGLPLVVLDRVGEGRVALLASDHTWLWHRGYDGGGPQSELLRRLAHWMMKEPELDEEALVASTIETDVTVLRRTLIDGPHQITATAPDGSKIVLDTQEIRPGRFSASFNATQLGLYRLASGDLTNVIAVGTASPKEFEEIVASADKIGAHIRATGGGIHAIEEGVPSIRTARQGRTASGRNWIGLLERDAYQTTDIRLIRLVSALLFLLAAAGLMITGWLREGR